jgi:hypothetical protein
MAQKEAIKEDPIEKYAWMVGLAFIVVALLLVLAYHQYGYSLVLNQFPGSY